MKRVTFFLTLLLSTFVLCAQSGQETTSKQNVGLEFHTSGNPDRIHRTPMRLDIEVVYDTENTTVEVISYDSLIGEVYLIDNTNNSVVDYSTSINTTLSVPTNYSSYTIKIVGENWYAIGILNL